MAQFETVVAGHRPFDEQLQGRKSQGLGAVQHRDGRWAIEGFQALHEFALGPQALAAGGQDMHLRRRAQDAFAERRNGVEQVLAVVDHQQHLPLAQEARQAGHRFAVVQRQVEEGRQVAGDHLRVVERRQVQQADAVAVLADQLFGDPQGHGGLADAAGADQGDETLARQLPHHIVHQHLAADQAGAAHRQVMPARLGGSACGALLETLGENGSREKGATKL